jgi:tRNA pseudouridine32 synthase/23S rRNA pseudouridine746 synthase/23S rRNA pseudouridine1911/1915/1917 synthase
VLETAEILALDKPPGISVMGERHDEDVVELAERAGERLYPVHRIDKVTSGVVLLARTLAAHGPLTRQFAARSAAKGYLAVVHGTDLPPRWTIDLPLGVGRKNRVRIAAPRERLRYDASTARWSVDPDDVIAGKPNYPSVTEVHRLLTGGGTTLVLALPRTGRRHQIRVHLAWTGAAIVGDPLFRTPAGPPAERTHLHSWRLHLPESGLDLTADPDAGFLRPLAHPEPGEALAAAVAVWAGTRTPR